MKINKKINRQTTLLRIMFFITLFVCNTLLNAQPPNPLEIKPKNLKLFAGFYESYESVKNITETLIDITKVVKKIETNEPTISEPESSWNDLANNYKAAAEKIQQTPLITDFDKTPFRISAEELANCDNKIANINKLKAFRDALALSLNDGKAELEKIKTYKEHLENSRKALVYLKDVHAKLISNPLFVELFKWDWLALNTNVSSALSSLTSAVTQQENKLTNEISKTKLHHDNLASNISLLETSLCTPAGRYSSSEYSATADYRHGNCRWRMNFTRIKISFQISADMQIRQSSLTVKEDENPTQGNCGNNPAYNDSYSYYNALINGNTIMINFTPASSNGQKCRARLDGIIRNDRIDGTLTFQRYDQPNFPTVQYKINLPITISKGIPTVPEL